MVVKIFFIPESDSLEVQTLLAAVDSHHLPQVGLPLYLEAKVFVVMCVCIVVVTSYLILSPP